MSFTKNVLSTPTISFYFSCLLLIVMEKTMQIGKDYLRSGILARIYSNVGFLGQILIFIPVW